MVKNFSAKYSLVYINKCIYDTIYENNNDVKHTLSL